MLSPRADAECVEVTKSSSGSAWSLRIQGSAASWQRQLQVNLITTSLLLISILRCVTALCISNRSQLPFKPAVTARLLFNRPKGAA